MPLSRDDFPDTVPVTAIEVDTCLGLLLGLSSEIFVPAGHDHEDIFGTELFRTGDSVYIQSVGIWPHQQKKGHFSALLNTLLNLGFTIKVPNPFPHMCRILEAKNFHTISEPHPLTLDIDEVMIKKPERIEI